jgi:Divergent InlB B-repeat domain
MFGFSTPMAKRQPLARIAAIAAGLMAVSMAAHSQQAIVGGLTNFDAVNYEGKDAYGFEIQIEGLKPADLGFAWNGNKFGTPEVVPYATGVYVRYKSPWDPLTQQFTAKTVPKTPGVGFAGTCYMGTTAYFTAGCDHFGPRPLVYTGYTVVAYRWMFPDPANPGQLVASANNLFVPTPVYTFVPAAVVGNPPVLVAEIDLPPAPAAQYGDATWMKVYKTELGRPVTLDELVDTNAVVPQNLAQVETDWKLMQPSPPGSRKQRGRHVNQGSPNAGSRAVIRRYETYAYTGAYDPITHEAVCGGDATCNAPQPGELGDMLVAQMAAANIAVPSITVSKVGSGNVASADKAISCGSKCAANYAQGTAVILTAAPASNNAFSGWTGACTGAASSCTVAVNDALNVTATFVPAITGGGGGGGGGTTQFSVSIGRSNVGTVTATPSGNDRGLNCGSACSAKFNAGTAITLQATPPVGLTFLGWGGACAGLAPTCNLVVNTNLSVQANFSK